MMNLSSPSLRIKVQSRSLPVTIDDGMSIATDPQ